MILFITILIILLVVEAYFLDPYFWSRGMNDKPWSQALYATSAWVFAHLLYFNLLDAAILTLFTRIALFDPILNVSQKNPICYHPDKNWYERFWRQFSCEAELITRGILFLIGISLSLLI